MYGNRIEIDKMVDEKKEVRIWTYVHLSNWVAERPVVQKVLDIEWLWGFVSRSDIAPTSA
jgi:hypothetical protein